MTEMSFYMEKAVFIFLGRERGASNIQVLAHELCCNNDTGHVIIFCMTLNLTELCHRPLPPYILPIPSPNPPPLSPPPHLPLPISTSPISLQ